MFIQVVIALNAHNKVLKCRNKINNLILYHNARHNETDEIWLHNTGDWLIHYKIYKLCDI